MAEIIKMPKLSDTMTEGVVAKWHKKIGDKVEEGELLAEIETDKATMEFESYSSGVILHHGVAEGKAAEVDSVLAIVGKKGEKFDDLLSAEPQADIEEADANETVTAVKEKAAPKVDVSSIPAKVIPLPKLSDTMTEGVLAKWHKKLGDKVDSGELLAEIETDKATMEFESFEEGTLLYQGLKEGESAPVDVILAVIGDKKADFQTLVDNYSVAAESTAPEPASTPEVKSAPAPTPVATQPKIETHVAVGANGRIKASPLAKKLAKEKGINLSSIVGSGTNGRIIKADVENYSPSSIGGGLPALMQEKYTEVEVSQMRKTIARRLGESKFSAPHFYLTVSIDMAGAIKAREAVNDSIEGKISYNDLVILAAAKALKKHPNVNAAWYGDKIRYNEHVNIGVAVAVEEGLLVPVVRYADGKSLPQINAEVKELAGKARDKKLQPHEWEGSTFTISNLGMFGIEEFTAIINPPDACILAVGAMNEVPVVKNGELTVGHVMKVTMSCDHRVVDGATGAQFLQTFKKFLENPITMYI